MGLGGERRRREGVEETYGKQGKRGGEEDGQKSITITDRRTSEGKESSEFGDLVLSIVINVPGGQARGINTIIGSI